MKPKAKILSMLLAVSYIFGCVFPTSVNAMISPAEPKQHGSAYREALEVSGFELDLMLLNAAMEQDRTGKLSTMDEFVDRVRTRQIILRIRSTGDLFEAVSAALACYPRFVHDYTIINFIMQYIKEHNVNVNLPYRGKTLLYTITRDGEQYEYFARFLLNECHADPNIPSNRGWTPLHRAVMGGYSNMISTLLDNGANPYVADEDGYTPYAIATAPIEYELYREGISVLIGEPIPAEIQNRMQRKKAMANVLHARGITH